jgi:protein-S-isoprenylcysteine O-methyltransferase Ste14
LARAVSDEEEVVEPGERESAFPLLKALPMLAVPVAFAVFGLIFLRRSPPLPFEAVRLAGMVVQIFIRVPWAQRSRSNVITHQRVDLFETISLASMFLGMMILPLVAIVTSLLDAAKFALPREAQIAGVILLAAGLWLFYRSHADLGRNWSPTLELRHSYGLVDVGVYRRIRHPMYAAIWLLLLATPLLVPNLIGSLFGILAFAIMYFRRIYSEEAMMRERFGAAWDVNSRAIVTP